MGIKFAGIHHVTAIAGDPQENVDFYAGLLGLRLVKKTVNFDDPQSYPWRAPDDETLEAWREELASRGLHVTSVLDRNYFHSIYFREPGGVLFEIATDPPGFAVDEDPDHLGESLKLPPWLEKDRDRIEAVLPFVRLPQEKG